MALIWADRVRDTTASTGTGTLTVSGSPPVNYQALNTEFATDDLFEAVIVHQTQAQWEQSLCRYLGSNNFERVLVHDGSSGPGTLVNFSPGTKDVAHVSPAHYGTDESLTAARTYYVRTGGSNLNSGLVNTDAGAFADYNFAYNYVVQNIDTNGQIVNIVVQNAAWTTQLSITKPFVGGGIVFFDFSGGTLTVTGGDCINITIQLGAGSIRFKNVTLSTVTSGNCLYNFGGGQIIVHDGVTFGACAGNHVVAEGTTSKIAFFNPYSISGAAASHLDSATGGYISASAAVTVSGTLNFTSAFAFASIAGIIFASGATYTGGTVTGKRYEADSNSVISVGGGATFFPGNVAGTTATGGQYV